MHKTLEEDAMNVGERLGQNETFFMSKRNEVFRYASSKETTTIWPLWDLSTDLLVMSHNQLGKTTCPFILFIENSSHMCYAVRMADFNFLAQLIIITILYSRQNKSPNSTWCQSLSSLNRISESKCELWEKECCMDWELLVNDMWRVVGITRTCSLLACSCLVKVERFVSFSLCCH